MKVDSRGQPICEGTFGLWEGQSAKVIRTFVDPTKDDENTQEAIANGGYVVSLGESGEVIAAPESFTSTYDGDHVKAEDGTVVQVGDHILCAEDNNPNRGQPVRVKHLYPIGTLMGPICCEVEHIDGRKISGSGPTGQWCLTWGEIKKVVKKTSGDEEVEHTNTTSAKGIEGCPAGVIYPGDLVKTSYSGGKGIWRVHEKGEVEPNVILLEPYDDEAKASDKAYHKIAGSGKYPDGMLYSKEYVSEVVKRASAESVGKNEIDLESIEIGDWIAFVDGKTVLSGIVTDTKHRGIRVALDKAFHKTHAHPDNYKWNVLGTIVDHIKSDNNSTNEGNEDMAAAANSKKSVGKVDVTWEGTQIILPESMGLRTAIKELQRQAEQEEMDVAIMEIIDGFPLDAAIAFVRALEQKYGWVNALPTPGFFGPQPPVMIGVQVDPEGRTVQIPWGQLGIPGITGTLSTGIQFKDNKPCFCIGGTVKQRDKGVVNEIALLTKKNLRENSIYKGKAVRMKFPTDPKKFSPLDHQPKFIQTTDVRPEELIFSKDVEKQIRVNIWTPIQNLAAVKAARVPLKRGVLLFGNYGVGKTLLASVTARMAVQAGVTFIDLEDSNQLPQAVEFGRGLGGMVVIFAEDIDRCDEDGSRTDAFNHILNTVDGLTSKTDEVMVVYTTNHIEKISKAMLRQGRIDKVINIKAPDADAAQRLVRLYARHMLDTNEDLTEVGELLTGFIPAAIREVVEQSKLAAIERGDVHHITAEDLRVTAEGTREHMDLLKPAPKDDRSELEKLGDALGKRIFSEVAKAWDSEDEDSPGETGQNLIDSISKRKVA